MTRRLDTVVVGSGPNGLAAAITVAQRGGSVLVLEAAPELGGGMRSAEVTLPGFVHDICSAVHPLGVGSPFFRRLPLHQHGLQWIWSPAELAHPLDDGTAAVLYRSVEETAEGLGGDARAYRELMGPLAARAEELIEEAMRPVLHVPRHPLLLARFGLKALQPASRLARRAFHHEPARALFGGIAAHSMIPLSFAGSSAIGLMLALAGHAYGWPIPRGGSQSLASALASYLRSLGGEIRTGEGVASLDQLPPSRWVFLDVTPKQLASIGASRLTQSQQRRLARFRYGMGVFKMDFALSGPVPWTAPECARAATVHVGGSLSKLEVSERAAYEGHRCGEPFVLVAQQSLFDSTRAPEGQQTLWAYCHVPNGSTHDVSEVIETQIERYAPGFRDRILARSVMGPAALEQHNPNYVGGDISGGAMNLAQVLFRPRVGISPYNTPIENVFLCSSSTPPGPGVHGMCGHLAAMQALSRGR